MQRNLAYTILSLVTGLGAIILGILIYLGVNGKL